MMLFRTSIDQFGHYVRYKVLKRTLLLTTSMLDLQCCHNTTIPLLPHSIQASHDQCIRSHAE